MKVAVFWLLAPCGLAEVCRRFRGFCCLHHRPDNGGSKHLLNVGKILSDHTAQQPEDSHLHFEETLDEMS
jgi:hypothetical protein